MDTEEETQVTERTISESTNIRIRLVIALLALCAAGFGGWIWWASSISAKIDVLISQQQTSNRALEAVSSKVSDLESWRKLVDTIGTPAMVTRVNDLQKQMEEMSRKFELHEAKSKP